MEIKIIPGAVDVIALEGTIDALTAPDMIAAFSKHINEGHLRLVVDFQRVEFMSSAGLRALLVNMKEARNKGGDLRLASVPAVIERVLDVTGFPAIVRIFASVEEAVGSFE